MQSPSIPTGTHAGLTSESERDSWRTRLLVWWTRLLTPQRVFALGLTYFALFLLPVVLATLTFPFAWMDHLAAIPLYLKYGCCSFKEVLPNFYWNWFHSQYVRPTAAALYSIQYAAFGGEFWLWFVVRWVVEVAAVGLAVSVLWRLGANRAGAWFMAVLLLFHPAATPLYLFTSDILVALGVLAVLALTLAGAPDRSRVFDLDDLSPGRYAAVLIVWFLALGVKEVAFVFCALITLAFTLWSRKSMRTFGKLSCQSSPFLLTMRSRPPIFPGSFVFRRALRSSKR